MWCNPWELKEAIKPLVYGLTIFGAGVWSLWAFAKITYKLHKMGIIK